MQLWNILDDFMQSKEGRLISIRKLVAADIALHGYRFILVEFAVGAPAMIAFGLWLILTNALFFIGLYICLVGINYIVLLLYAIAIYRKHSALREVSKDIAHDQQYLRKYGSQQFLILVPFAIIIIAFVQELRRS